MNPTPDRFLRSRPWTLLLALSLIPFVSARAADYYLTVAGSGAKTGASWADAYAVSSLWTTVNTTMQPGDTLYIGGPETSGGATYGDQRLTISSSGTATAKKSLVGVDRGFGLPQFIGVQATRSYTTITLADTVSHWTIKNLHIEHRDYGIATAGAGHVGITIDGVTVRDTRSACYSLADCDDLLIQNCKAERYSGTGFKFVNACDGVTIRNCVANCTSTGFDDDPAWRTKASGPVGFDFHVKNSTAAFNTDVLLEDCVSLNNNEDTADTADYEQGDGYKLEQRNSGVTFLRCIARQNQDAGFDLKGASQLLEDCTATGNFRYGFKVWYQGTLNDCAAVNNGARQFTFAALSAGYTVTVNNSTFHCRENTSQVGAIIETAGNTLVINDSILSFGGAAGTYTGGNGAFSLTNTVKLANTANTANAPQYLNPVLPWDGTGTDFDNLAYGTTKGYNSGGYTGGGGGGGVASNVASEADTYAQDGSYAATNYGTNTTLVVKSGSSGSNRISYLRFPIAAGGTVLSATLHLKVTGIGAEGAGARTVEIRQLSDDSWTETGTTWNNRPSSVGTLIATIDAGTVGQTYSVDVSNFVGQEALGDGKASFVLAQPSGVGKYVTFGSRENVGNEPVLEVVREVQALVSEADTYVQDGSYAAVNYGTDVALAVKNASSGNNRVSYLRFPLSGIGAFGTATLNLKVTGIGAEGAGARTVEIRQLSDDSWTETGTTWNNRPSSVGTLIATIDAGTVGQTYNIDVSGFVTQEAAGDGKASFVLVQPSGVGKFVKFGSRESSGNEPLLQLQ